MENRILKGKGEMNYDFENDILFFKTVERVYKKSIEFDNLVLDLDEKDFITGIQIFEASHFLKVSKTHLVKIPNWTFEAQISEGKIEIRVVFQVMVRNKIVEKNPIIMQAINEPLPNSKMTCAV